MAKPIETIEEILLLKPGVSLVGLEAGPMNTLVREFQRMLGGGQLCEELRVFDFKRAEKWKNEFSLADALEHIDNRSGLRAEKVSSLWPVFSHGDGHTFYYYAAEKRFIAHYHDPDTLESIGTQFFEAINVALDANFHSIPEDFSPVYWKPTYEFRMSLDAVGRRISPQEFFAANEGGPQPSHVYCGSRRCDLIWERLYAHLHYTLTEGSEFGPMVGVRFSSFQASPEVNKIMENLKRSAGKLALEVYQR